MRQIKTVPSLFPQVCGICEKINENSLCKKCELKINKQINICFEQQIEDKYFNELICVFKYEGLIRKLLLDYKFKGKSYLYKTIAKVILKQENIFKILESYDTIMPIPISKKRRKERGYNQSELIAKEIAKNINIKYQNNCLIKTKNIIEQSKLNREQRILNIQGAYVLKNEETIKNKKILLFDDIYTTGSTVNECSRILRKVDLKKIGILTIAKD